MKNDPDKRRERRHGITKEDYNCMIDKQDNRCAICAKRFGGEKHNKPHVDHNHTTGKVRGLLCFSCNTGIGQFKDNPAQVLRALNYLNKHARIAI